MTFISDILADDHLYWQPGTFVFFDADTGTGKSTVIRTKIWTLALSRQQEVLYLTNRIGTHRQIVAEFCNELGIDSKYFEDESFVELPGITIATYQSVAERVWQRGQIVQLPYYHFVVADEVHYLVADATFAPQTMRIFEWMKKLNTDIFIAMSATPKEVMRYLPHGDAQWLPVYEEEDKKTFIRDARNMVRQMKRIPEFLWVYTCKNPKPRYRIFVYETVETLVDIINKDCSSEKWLIFQGNKQKALKQLKDKLTCSSQLITADNREDEVMKQIVKNYCFETKVLVTTQVLDNGISLKDMDLVNIVIETLSEVEFKQMLGRKRILKNDYECINLYLPQMSSKYFRNLLNFQLNPILEFLEISKEEALERAMKNENDYKTLKRFYDVRDGVLIRNEIAVAKIKRDRDFCEKMINALEKDKKSWVKQQLRWLELDENHPVIYLDEGLCVNARNELLTLLTQNLDRELDRDEQEAFRNKVTELGHILCPDMTKHGKDIWGKVKINKLLEKQELFFSVESIGGKKKGEESRWKIQRI